MKTAAERIHERFDKPQEIVEVSLRLPKDALGDMEEIAPSLGFATYKGLMKAYISRGLREDLRRLEGSNVQALTESLRRHGVADEAISAAIEEAGLKTA
jgi:hypothetical protein